MPSEKKEFREKMAKLGRLHLFHNHLIQIALDPGSFQDDAYVQITACPRLLTRWDDPVLRRRIAR